MTSRIRSGTKWQITSPLLSILRYKVAAFMAWLKGLAVRGGMLFRYSVLLSQLSPVFEDCRISSRPLVPGLSLGWPGCAPKPLRRLYCTADFAGFRTYFNALITLVWV